MSVSSIITRGYGSYSSVNFLPTRGFGNFSLASTQELAYACFGVGVDATYSFFAEVMPTYAFSMDVSPTYLVEAAIEVCN